MLTRLVAGGTFDTHIIDQFDTPPDIMLSLSRHLACSTKGFPMPGRIFKPSGRNTKSVHTFKDNSDEFDLLEPCPRIALITSIYKELGPSIDTQSQNLPLSQRARNALKIIISRVPNAEWLRDLPHGVSLPILEILRACQYSPEDDWTREMYILIGRPDMAMKATRDRWYEDLVKDDWPSGVSASFDYSGGMQLMGISLGRNGCRPLVRSCHSPKQERWTRNQRRKRH